MKKFQGYVTEAENFGDSFAMDYFISEETIKNIKQAVKHINNVIVCRILVSKSPKFVSSTP